MTLLNPYIEEEESLKELLIKNLPPYIKAGNEKEKANIFKFHTHIALKTCKFINYNTSQRVSFMIFDLDSYKDKKAIETFKNIDMFNDYLLEHIGYEPTFILQTDKGYHFAYHLKNHIFLNQQKALNYLNNIKLGIIEKLGCDIYGSTRNYGVWRNPLKHKHYFSSQINYELNDFKEFAISKKTIQQKFKRDITIRQLNKNLLVKGNRNNVIFFSTMKWAKNHKNLSCEDIYSYALTYNNQAKEPLDKKEVSNIAKSVYRYYINNLIYISTQKRDIKEGAMGFDKIRNLTFFEYQREVKRRQSLSAKRTNSIVNKSQKKELMLKAKNIHIENQKRLNLTKIKNAIEELTKLGLNVNNSSIAKISGLDRKTVRKYRAFMETF